MPDDGTSIPLVNDGLSDDANQFSEQMAAENLKSGKIAMAAQARNQRVEAWMRLAGIHLPQG